MPKTDHEKLTYHSRPSNDSFTGVPIKKRRFFFARSPSPPPSSPPPTSPPQIPLSLGDHDLLQKEPFPSNAGPSCTETVGGLAQLTGRMVKKAASSEFRVESIDGDMPLKQEMQPGFKDQIDVKGTGNVRDTIIENKCAIMSVSGSALLQSAVCKPIDPPKMEGNFEGKYVQNEVSSVTQEKMEHQSLKSKSLLSDTDSAQLQQAIEKPIVGSISEGHIEGKFDWSDGSLVKQGKLEEHILQSKVSDSESKDSSARVCMDRSNWDLNTTMDAWEGSSSCSTIAYGTGDRGRQAISAAHNNLLESEHNGAGVALGICELQKDDQHLNLSNLSVPAVEFSNSETCLDLRLRPSFMTNLKEMPFLSLSMKSMVSDKSPKFTQNGDLKSEPNGSSSRKDNKNVEVVSLKPVGLRHVKSEPCEGQENLKTQRSGDMRTTCSRAVKLEPNEDLSQLSLRSQTGISSHVQPKNQNLTVQNTVVQQDTCKDNSKDPTLTSKFFIPGDINQHSDRKIPDTNTSKYFTDMVDGSLSLGNRAPNHGSDVPLNSSILHGAKEIVTKPSGLVSIPLTSDGNGTNSVNEIRQAASLPSVLLPESVSSDGKCHMTVDGIEHVPSVVIDESFPKFAVQMSSPIGQNMSTMSSIDLVKNHQENMVIDSDDSKGKLEVAIDSLEHLPSDCRLHNPPVAGGAVDKSCKLSGNEEEDFEDGEVRDPTLKGAVDGSFAKKEDQQVKDDDFVSPVGVPISVPACVEEVVQTQNSEELKNHSNVECDGGVRINKDEHCSSTVAALTADPATMKISKTIRKAPKAHLEDKGLENELKISGECALTEVAQSDQDLKETTTSCQGLKEVAKSDQRGNGSQQNGEGSDVLLAEEPVPSKIEPSEKYSATKDATVKANIRRIIYLNSASNKFASGKMRPTSGRLVPSQIERERPIDKSFRRERPFSRKNRDEPFGEKFRKVDGERNYGHPVGKHGTDFMRGRNKTDNRLNTLHNSRNSAPDHLPEQNNSSAGVRFSRNASEVGTGASMDGSVRLVSKPANDELQNLSHAPCRRRSPGGRAPMVRHPRDISPNMCVGRDVPDFVLLAHEENLMRNMPDDMLEPPMHSDPRSNYERSEGVILRRERRSLSPLQRRGAPHLPRNCVNSSPRSQQRSPRQWSPPWRSPEGFNVQQELVHCRSSPIIRLDRMRSPHQHPCFPEEMMVRRRGSPPYIGEDAMDIGPPREHDFPRQTRGPNRNMRRRFNLIDPREIADEEYFGPPLLHNQIHEFAEDDEYVEERRLEERRGRMRSFRQRYIAGDDNVESFRFHEDGPARPFRLCAEGNDVFPEGENPRNFNGRFRNRLGNSAGRMRGAEEQEGNYRHPGEQGLHDASFNGVRPQKRRRF